MPVDNGNQFGGVIRIGGTTADPNITLNADGNIQCKQLNGNNVRINVEPNDPANYTTTTIDGEEQQVYNGPTLDVKERLTKADVALQNLKTAVATAVDFAELKAAMTTALADI